MSIPVLYAMLTDDALRNITEKIDTTSAFDQGFGVLQGEYSNYFNHTGIISGNRRTRLSVLDSTTAYGNLQLLFDLDRFDPALFVDMADTDFSCIMNIVERCYLKQAFSDINVEYMLRNTASFNGYVENTYIHDTAESTVNIRKSNGDVIDIPVFHWFSFEFRSSVGIQFKLHIWISSDSFGKEYPYTTITSVIPPCDPKLLTTPSVLAKQGVISLLQDSSSYIFSDMNVETLARDQNGVYVFRTKYVVSGNSIISLPFALPYRGAKEPDSLSCRQAIRDYLREHTQLTDTAIERLFPELFVDSRFFIIPLWDLFSTTCDREIYNSVYSYKAITDKISKLFKTHESSFVENHLEFITNAQNTMLSLVLPDELNAGSFSILAQHPTYQNFSTSTSGFRYMESKTQEFAALLYRAFAVLTGETISAEFYTTNLDGNKYVTFTNDKSEYLIMYKKSYTEILNQA